MKTSSREPGTVLRLANRRLVVDQRQGNSAVLRERIKEQRPLQRVEIDHTPLDISLISINREVDDEDLFA